MIISVRGTNGSGKSHLARRVMSLYRSSVPHRYPPDMRKRVILGTTLLRPGGRSLFVPGHYEIANGGIDTMPSVNFAYNAIWEAYDRGEDVLFEGKNMQDGTKDLLRLYEMDTDVRAVFLSTPLEQCVGAVRGRGHSICEDTIRKLQTRVTNQAAVFAKAGVQVVVADRESAFSTIRGWLEIC